VTVDGGAGGTDGTDADTLDLDTWALYRNLVQTADADGNSTSGSIEVQDAAGSWITVHFTEIERLVLPAPLLNYIVEGTSGDDIIGGSYTGDPEGDRIDNNDALDGSNDDSVEAGAGNDTIFSDLGNDTVNAGEGDDSVNAGAGDDVVYGGDGADLILGQNGNDLLFGEDGNDIVNGGAGNDTLNGDEGNDTVVGGEGNDQLYGSGGDDVVSGEDGDDTIFGGDGADTLSGGLGNDIFYGGSGDDSVTGGAGNDTLNGNEGADTLIGGDGADQLGGGDGNDSLDGGADANSLVGGLGNDILLGGDGNDTLFGNEGVDTLIGGAGDDSLAAGEDNDLVSGGDGNDTIEGDAGNDTLSGGIDDDSISGDAGNDQIFGDDGNDTLDGGTGDDTLRAGIGNDSMLGGDGNDTLVGEAGDDAILGGSGDDTFVLENAFGNDTITGGETGETDGDTLDLSAITGPITVDLRPNDPEEGTVFDGTDTAAFTEIENIILGSGQDTILLADGSGADAVTGFAAPTDNGDGTYTGNDLLDVSAMTRPDGEPVTTADVVVTADGNGNAVLTFPGGESLTLIGVDPTAVDSVAELTAMGIPGPIDGTSGDDVMGVGYSDADGDQIDGTDGLNDTIFGFGGDDRIDGGAGDDSIEGGEGNDTLSGGAGSNVLLGGAGNDTFIAGAGADFLEGGAGQDNLDVSAATTGVNIDLSSGVMSGDLVGNDSLGFGVDGVIGSAFDDTLLGFDDFDPSYTNQLSGGDGDDLIDGRGGDDLLSGDAGNDSIIGGEGDDTIEGGTGDDTIQGGTGDDIIDVAQSDTVSGGDGDDTFNLVDLGETNGDTLNLNGLADRTTLTITDPDDANGGLTGTVALLEGTIVDFANIEDIICFVPGTLITTPLGLRRIEDLCVGDPVLTQDNGIQNVGWIGKTTVAGKDRFAPVNFAKSMWPGAMDDLTVSPQHRMLIKGYRAELLFGQSEVLVPAVHLLNGKDVTRVDQEEVTYVHIMFQQHEIIFANGIPAESFHPGSFGVDAMAAHARDELFALFPELRSNLGAYGGTARLSLKAKEAKMLVDFV